MKEERKKEIIGHIEDVIRVFQLENRDEYSKLLLYTKLKQLDTIAHKFAEDCCNFLDLSDEEHDKKVNKILDRVDKLLNFRKQNIPVFFNGDPRGYSLKIDDKWLRDNNMLIHKDWGGYGIIAPSF